MGEATELQMSAVYIFDNQEDASWGRILDHCKIVEHSQLIMRDIMRRLCFVNLHNMIIIFLSIIIEILSIIIPHTWMMRDLEVTRDSRAKRSGIMRDAPRIMRDSISAG